MFCTKLKQSGILIFLICILFITSCAKRIKERLEAKPVIREWGNDQIQQKREECRTWWSQYKNQLQEFIVNKINL